jgi:hypothetical protein
MTPLARAAGYYFARLAGASRQPLARVARDTVELSPRRVFRARTPYYEEAHLARIEGAPWFSAREIIDDHLRRRTIEFRPVRVHRVAGAWLIGGSAFIPGSSRIDLRNLLRRRPPLDRLSLVAEGPRMAIDEAVLAATCAGATWFGHWLEDEVPLLVVAKGLGRGIAPRRAPYAHEPGYLAAFGLEAPLQAGVAEVGTLTVIEEFAQNPHKTRRYAELRARLRANQGRGQRIFLLRGGSGEARPLVNEPELAACLEREGFDIVDVANTPFDELVERCRAGSGRRFVADPGEVLGFLDRLLAWARAEDGALGAYVDEVLAWS